MTEKPIPAQKTPLYSLHQEMGARMAPFAGFAMPIQFPKGILEEHRQTRRKASLFDVSHMGQADLHISAEEMETIFPADILGMKKGQMRYSFLLNEEGGILDDLIITRLDDALFRLVVNASRRREDFEYLRERLPSDARLDEQNHLALLALQGPAAETILSRYFKDLPAMAFMTARAQESEGTELLLHRSGYTGEDGFEISLDAAHAQDFARLILEDADAQPAGLGARDSLRLEAGLCLYGNDIDETTTPIEAGLLWAIPQRRRDDSSFPGARRLLSQIQKGVRRKRAGFLVEGRIPARSGAEILDEKGSAIGRVTSGAVIPHTEPYPEPNSESHKALSPIAMGYVPPPYATQEKESPERRLALDIRGKSIAMRLMSFRPPRYHILRKPTTKKTTKKTRREEP